MRLALLAALLFTLSASTVAADTRGEAEEQLKFGIKLAQNNLWREATFWFKKATALDMSYAAAWNNLAIAYERQGDLESARDAYDKALTLDRDNQYIKQNYELFKEINDRATRQNRR
jgi:Tfp pilus assembly protein PilF